MNEINILQKATTMFVPWFLRDKEKEPWPQTLPPSGEMMQVYPNYKTTGFLAPLLIPPFAENEKEEDPGQSTNPTQAAANPIVKTFGKYKYIDWRGHTLELLEAGVGDTKERFEVHKGLNPKDKTPTQIINTPYSIRDHYLIFNDQSQDYFRHGLQILDGINIPQSSSDFWRTQRTKETATRTSIDGFKGTPFENNDPVMFGFEIIFDDISSPLLNGSIDDFLQLFENNISEIAQRRPIYEEFKQQFVKFFRTRANVRIDSEQTKMTAVRPFGYADSVESGSLYGGGRKSYMSYYLKKVTGLSKLIEGNTADTKSFLTDYNKDIITLSFNEDVSLSVGTLAHLYKLLYWSKPNAKTMIPENLLRFNCDIIVSEVRNFNRVRKSIETGDIQVIKDNVSRYIYSLKECQFYFNTLPHEDTIDLGTIKAYDTYDVQFDYKYSTVKFEKFVPDLNSGVGKYVGYDGGAMWRLGGKGSRETQKAGQLKYGVSSPRFYTENQNKFNQNGVENPIILSVPIQRFVVSSSAEPENTPDLTFLQKVSDKIKNRKKSDQELALRRNIRNVVGRELQTAVNSRVALLNKSLDKILNAAGITGVSPPKNIYTDEETIGGRLFKDLRGQLVNFVGNAAGNIF